MGAARNDPRLIEANRAGPRLARLCAIACLFLAPQIACIHGPRYSDSNAGQTASIEHTHTVLKGENLYRIALNEGVSLEALERANGIQKPGELEVGQRLLIPGAQSTSPTSHASVLGGVDEGGIGSKDRPLPRLLWPVRGVIFSTFGHRGNEHHDGVDLAAPEGTTIVAAADGLVLFAGEQRGYGQILLLQHANDVVTVYAHNSENLARAGDHVLRGQPIARVGRTGNASGPHVHFEVRVAARPRDPLEFLR